VFNQLSDLLLFIITDEEPPIIEHFPQRVHNELKLISSWLQRCDATTDYLSVYASVRSHAVVKSLQWFVLL